MKSSRILFAAALTFSVALGVVAFASDDESSVIIVKPSNMKDGETKTLIDGGKKVTLRRNGEDMEVTIEKGGKTDRLVIRRNSDGEVEINGDRIRRRMRVIGPGHERIFIDGLPMGTLAHPRLQSSSNNWFACPKDHSLLRVPEGKEDATYRCPVDGTVMEKRKGRGMSFWFSDEKETEKL